MSDADFLDVPDDLMRDSVLPIRSLVAGRVVDLEATMNELNDVADHGCFPSWPQVDRTDTLIFALKAWLDAGGARPDWTRWPKAASEYRWRMTHERR